MGVDVAFVAVLAVVALAALFDYTNGFHDSANAIATVVATRVLPPRIAVLWAASFNFIAFFIVGTAVADTVGATVEMQYYSIALVFAVLVGATTWNFVSWHLGLPTSSSHALVGGLVGAGITKGGLDAIHAASVEKTALFILISPIAGLVLGWLAMQLARAALRRADRGRTERRFRWLQLASSAAVSVAHGGNDAQKTIGVVTGLLVSSGHLYDDNADGLPVPTWLAAGAYLIIALGTMSGGWKIVRTVGSGITELKPVSGFCAEAAAAAALFGSTAMGAPVSTTHTVAGAVTGVGTANPPATVHWRLFRSISVAWVVTMPAAALVACLTYLATQLPIVAASIILGVGVVVLVVLLLKALQQAPSAKDVADQLDGLQSVAIRPGAGSVISTGRMIEQSEQPW